MNSTIDIIIKAATLLLVAISTFLAIFIYYRNKKIELENALFKMRLEAIANIQMDMVIISQKLDKLKLFIKDHSIFTAKDIKDLSLEIDETIYKSQTSMVKYAVYFSAKTSEKIYVLAADLLGDLRVENHEQLRDKVNEYCDKMTVSMDAVIDELRDESGIDTIHKSLMTRFLRNKSKIEV